MTYNEAYYANYGGLTVEEYVDKYIRSSLEEMNRMITTINLIPEDVKSLLDVGAGHGIFLDELKKTKGINGVGIEITDAKVNYGKTIGVDMRKGDAANLNFQDGSFDAVVASEVLEHLPYGIYEAALTELARVAKKYIIITVPFMEKRVFVQCPYCGGKSNPSCHFRSFSQKEMDCLFSNAKLQRTLKMGQILHYPFEGAIQHLIPKKWPIFLVCPSCGFKKEKVDFYEDNDSTPKISTGGLLKEVLRRNIKIFGRNKARWILGIYSIID